MCLPKLETFSNNEQARTFFTPHPRHRHKLLASANDVEGVEAVVQPMQHGVWNDSFEHGPEEPDAGAAGATYLRSLRQSEPAGTPDPVPTSKPTPAVERRRSLRYRCHGSAEFRIEDSDIRTWGTLSDISLHGCYVEMAATYPVNTKVQLVIEAAGVRVQATGEVRVSYPFLGMGISFQALAPEQAERLRELLQRLSAEDQPLATSTEIVGSDGVSISLPTFASAGEFVKELSRYFEAHPALSRDEFRSMVARWAETR